MELYISQKLINQGERSSCTRCPIALAVHDYWLQKFGHYPYKVMVSPESTEVVGRNGQTYGYQNSGRAEDFIDAFDNSQIDPRPQSVTLYPIISLEKSK